MAMFKKKVREEDQEEKREDEYKVLHKKTIKEIIAPAGIDASKLDHMEIVSNVTRYARSFFVSGLPRSCTFPELFRSLYMFGDINTSIYIYPVSEASSQNDLNKTIVELETERLSNSRLRQRLDKENQSKVYIEQLENILKFAITNHIGNLRGGMQIERYGIDKMQNLKLSVDYEPQYHSYIIRVNY